MSETTPNFVTARQSFRDHLRAHKETMASAFTEVTLANEQQALHRARLDNPHNVTKAQIGLPLLENRAPATLEDIVDLTHLDRLITPATFQALLNDPRITSGSLVNAVRTPRPVNPVDETMVDTTDTVTLIADEYRHMYSREIDGTVKRIPRLKREFELYQDGQLETPIWSGETTTSDQITAPVTLTRRTLYRWRCRDHSIDQEVSRWSPLTRFFAPDSEVQVPTVIWEGGRYTTVQHPLITASSFTTEGDSDIHVSTTWALYAYNAAQPLWEYTSSTDLTQVRIPREYLFQGISYQLSVTYHSATAGDATTGRLTFRTMDRFPFTPGPVDLQWGDDSLGYYGEVPAGEFINGNQLSVRTGFGAGSATPWSDNGSWLKIRLNNKVAYVSRYPLRYGFRGSDLEGLGLTRDGKEITYHQTLFRVRSLFGLDPNTPDPLNEEVTQQLGTSPENDPTLTQNSEYSRVISMIMTWLQTAGDVTEIGLTASYRHTVVAEYPTTDPSAPLVVRGSGGYPVGDARALTYVNKYADGSNSPLATPQSISWRPILIAVE